MISTTSPGAVLFSRAARPALKGGPEIEPLEAKIKGETKKNATRESIKILFIQGITVKMYQRFQQPAEH